MVIVQLLKFLRLILDIKDFCSYLENKIHIHLFIHTVTHAKSHTYMLTKSHTY